jgi:hypothetical protein
MLVDEIAGTDRRRGDHAHLMKHIKDVDKLQIQLCDTAIDQVSHPFPLLDEDDDDDDDTVLRACKLGDEEDDDEGEEEAVMKLVLEEVK